MVGQFLREQYEVFRKTISCIWWIFSSFSGVIAMQIMSYGHETDELTLE